MAASELVVMHAGQIDRGPLSAVDFVDGTGVILEASNADGDFAGLDDQFVSRLSLT